MPAISHKRCTLYQDLIHQTLNFVCATFVTVESSYNYLHLSRHATQVEARRFLTNKEECGTLERQGDHGNAMIGNPG